MQNDRFQLYLLYVITFFQGMAFAALPAISLALIEPGEFELTFFIYSLIFFSFVLAAIVLLSFSSGSQNLKQYLGIGLFTNGLGALLLTSSFMGSGKFPANVIVLEIVAVLLGVGFGALLPPLYNHLLGRSSKFWLALSLGMSFAPFLTAYFEESGLVWLTPLTIFVAFLLLYNFAILLPILNFKSSEDKEKITIWQMPWTFWLFFVIVILYGFCETSVGTWLPIYLHKVKKLSFETSTAALGIFWLFIFLGRAFIQFITRWISFKWFYALLPLFIFWLLGLLPELSSVSDLFKMAALTGFVFSGFLPLNVDFAEKYVSSSPWIFGGLLAGYLIGFGLGSTGIGHLLNIQKIPFDALYPFASLPASLLTIFAWIVLYFYRGVPKQDL